MATQTERIDKQARLSWNVLLAWGAAVLDLLMIAACLALFWITQADLVSLPGTVGFGLFPLAGAVIIWKQPRNPVGWLAVTLGYFFIAAELSALYAAAGLITHLGHLPLAAEASWVASWLWAPSYIAAVSLILRIPNGKLPSPRWSILVWFVVISSLAVTVTNMVALWPYRGLPLMQVMGNLSAIPGIGPFLDNERLIWNPAIDIQMLLAVFALFLRFKSARGMEREQLKWIFLAAALVPFSFVVGTLTTNASDPLFQWINQVLNVLSIVSFPTAIAIAITRYHLYEIDVIIRRTLVYSLLTATLALIYFASVMLLQSFFLLISGERSTVSIVLSTLFMAALFTPLRRRIQALINRRFYRQKYDADRMLEQFANRQREMVALEQFNAELLRTVQEGLQPEFVSLALVRGGEGRGLGGRSALPGTPDAWQ